MCSICEEDSLAKKIRFYIYNKAFSIFGKTKLWPKVSSFLYS